MGREHGNDRHLVLAALGLMDGGGIGEVQIPQVRQRIIRKAAVKVDSHCAGLDGGYRSNLAVEYTSGNRLVILVMQDDITIILNLHHSVMQPEQLAAKGDLRFSRLCWIDFFPDGLIQPVGRGGSLRAEGGEDLHLLYTGALHLFSVNAADQFRSLLLGVGLDKGEIPAIVQITLALLDQLGVVGN